MQRYMFGVIHPDGAPSVHEGVDLDEVVASVDAFNQRLEAEGRLVFATGLRPVGEARTVTLDDTRATTLVTDGPFVEAKEVLGGFWVLRATPDEVDDLARSAALACRTTIEVRPLEPEPDDDG